MTAEHSQIPVWRGGGLKKAYGNDAAASGYRKRRWQQEPFHLIYGVGGDHDLPMTRCDVVMIFHSGVPGSVVFYILTIVDVIW